MAQEPNFQVVPITEVAKTDESLHTGKHRPVVLIVDDERVIADTLSMILRKNGFSTLTAYDGKRALELASVTSPELLISDVVMPGMTGVELAIAITHMIPACKVLLFSGQAATADLLENARNAGYNFTTLLKPVHPTDMLRRISECLTMRGTLSEPVAEFAFSSRYQ